MKKFEITPYTPTRLEKHAIDRLLQSLSISNPSSDPNGGLPISADRLQLAHYRLQRSRLLRPADPAVPLTIALHPAHRMQDHPFPTKIRWCEDPAIVFTSRGEGNRSQVTTWHRILFDPRTLAATSMTSTDRNFESGSVGSVVDMTPTHLHTRPLDATLHSIAPTNRPAYPQEWLHHPPKQILVLGHGMVVRPSSSITKRASTLSLAAINRRAQQ